MKKPDKIILTISASLIVVAVMLYLFMNWQSSIFSKEGAIKGNVFQVLFSNSELKQDQNDRVNILVFGTSEDKPGTVGNHEENFTVTNSFTDSIFVLSIDKAGKTEYISVPRSLVIDGSPQCDYEKDVRLKVIYLCYSSSRLPNQTHMTGADRLRTEVEKVTGLNIPYFVKINYEVVRSLVDLVGGIDIVPFSDDDRGIYDPGTGIKISSGEQMHLNGENVMDLIRARNSKEGSYGLSEGEGARAKNQRIILEALVTKIKDTQLLHDAFSAVSFANALGNHVMTNFEASELRNLLALLKSISGLHLVNISDEQLGLMYVTDDIAHVLLYYPTAGEYDYTDIHKYIQDIISNDDNE